MHRISLAPVLSATLSRDSCWIISRYPFAEETRCDRFFSRSLGLLEYFHHAPALRCRQRPGLHQEHAVTDAGGVVLVVRLELVGAPDRLAVERVLDPVLDGDDDRLVHLVADDEPLPR